MDFGRVSDRLRDSLGGVGWWKADGPLEVVVGAILTQQSTWASVEVALARLKEENLLTLKGLATEPLAELEGCIKPAGFYRVKARRLRAVATRILKDHGSLERLLSLSSAEMRRYLLGLQGIGPETADSILLYAARRPSMVVDAYTRRIASRLGRSLPSDYHEAQSLLEGDIGRNVEGYQEFHAMMVEVGKTFCRKDPHCAPCPLLDVCPTGKNLVAFS